MDTEQIQIQQEKDRKELADLASRGINKPLSWCGQHDCKLGTCFSLHYPESLSSIVNTRDEDQKV